MSTQKHLKTWVGTTNSRSLKTARCHTCKQPILTGPDHDMAGVTARIDPTPLTNLGLLQAHTSGRPVYRLAHQGRALTATKLHRWLKKPLIGAYDWATSHDCHQPAAHFDHYAQPRTLPETSQLAGPDTPAPF